jgi:hypothetical protein
LVLVAKLIAVLNASGAGTPGRFCGLRGRWSWNRNQVTDPTLLVLLVDADDPVGEAFDRADDWAEPDALALVDLEHVAAEEPGAGGHRGVGDNRGDDVKGHQKRSGATSATSR